MKKLSYLFGALAVLLSQVRCAVVAYGYCDMLWGIQYACYSAPASVAFLLAIPYAVGIAACVILAAVFYRKAKR